MLAEHRCQQPFTSLYLAFSLAAWQAAGMRRVIRFVAKVGAWAVLTVLVATLHQSSSDAMYWPTVAREFRIEAKRFVPKGLAVKEPLRFVAAWRLRSGDRAFGGLSALAKIDGGFLALSDAGTLIRFGFDASGAAGRIDGLPAGCGGTSDRRSRDTESLTLEPDGAMLIGIERSNTICRIAPGGGAGPIAPPEMRGWPLSGGAEAMTRLQDRRLLAIAERPRDNGPVSPALLFAGEGTKRLRYRPPAGFRPTDVVQLPGGALLLLNRKFELPFSMLGRLVQIDRFDGGLMQGRTLAELNGPDLDQNFEGVAVSQARGGTYVWLISDDNFMPMQDTVLLLFEYRPRER